MALLNYIGLNGISLSVPPSGLYVDTLEGVRLDNISALREDNAQRDTITKVWNQIQARAIARLESDLLTAPKGKFRMVSAKGLSQAGWRFADNVTVAPSATYRGLFLEYWHGRFMEMRLDSVTLYSATATTTTVRVFDLVTGQQILALPWTLAVGVNRLDLNLTPEVNGVNERLFVCYDADTVSTISQTAIIYGNRQSVFLYEARASKTATLLFNAISTGNDLQGLRVEFTLAPSVSKFADAMRDRLKYALWYLLGSEFHSERLTSDEWNRVTLFNRDVSEGLRDKYAKEYQRTMLEVIAAMPRPDDESFVDDQAISNKFLL
jgi:hypothetical protein